MRTNLAKRVTTCTLAACLVAQPAFAGITDISNVPLGSTAGASYLPNLLFILDDSGSMASDYNPDYVNDNNGCMTNSGGNTNCTRGDPPYEAGGANGFNGVGYDPNFTYLSGLNSTGQPVINPPSGTLTPTNLVPDAYLGGGNVNVTSNFPDKTYCNSAGTPACKRTGANTSGTVTPAGTKDAEGHNLAAGQFPYRANISSRSDINFGMPEMMTTATFTRSGSTVTATTIGKFFAAPFAVNDLVYVTSGTAGLNVTCATVTSATTSTFTYTTTTSGAIAATTGSFRKCDKGSWARAGTTVTVTSTLATHGLQSNDLLFIDSSDNNQDKLTTATPITVSTNSTFTYTGANTGAATGTVAWVRTGLYNVVTSTSTSPAVYSLSAIEYCRDFNLTDCVEGSTAGTPPANPNPLCNPNCGAYTIPAYLRFCKTQNDALSPGTVTGTSIIAPATTPTARCQLKFVNQTGLTNYIYPRYGWFNRDTVVSTVASYVNRPGRGDCTSVGIPGTCSYTEEIQNYAKWYTYYRTRMQMMKTSAGRSFLPFISNPTATPAKPDRLRVGFITINPTFRNNNNNSTAPNVDSSKYQRIDTFNTTNASNWYSKFYSIIPNNSTPLRLALSRAGWIYSGKLNTGLTSGIPAADDPLQASCQKNFAFLTTDGFWNQGTGQDLAGNALGNMDNVPNSTAAPYAAPDYFVSRGTGTFDGGFNTATASTTPGGAGTLADIALYYYKTDLRGAPTGATGPATSPNTSPAGQDVSTNNVPVNPLSTYDFAIHQHMTTYSIGLADGLMRYQADYSTATTGDFAAIKSALPAAGNCYWAVNNPSPATCDWPLPVADGQSALDDLWHAAVNGRGKFYSAVNPNLLSTGLTGALNDLNTTTASAAAAATSSPNVSQGNQRAFSTTYQTATWSGKVYAQNIEADGTVDDPHLWDADVLLLGKVGTNTDSRNLFMYDPTRASKLKDFRFADIGNGALDPVTEQPFFKNKCVPLSTMAQCGTLNFAQQNTVNAGAALVGFLRGQTGNEATLFRDRTELDVVTNNPQQTVLGDIINGQPVAVFAPPRSFEKESVPESPGETYPHYRDTRAANRRGQLLVAANDGYLHSFDTSTGQENWGYVPRFLIPALYQLADSGYPGQHRFFVDGSPEVNDVFDERAGVWKTIVVGGTNSGGRGFYALDVTDPQNPQGLWEFCSDPTWCPNDTTTSPPTFHTDPDLGFSYGNPVIGRRQSDGKWVVVVTSGLNNVPCVPANANCAGNGQGYFYVLDAITGGILHKIGTGVGTTTDPSGLMKIGAYYPVGQDDPVFQRVYGGDQKGNVWRVDMSAPNMPAYPLLTTTGMANAVNKGRPIIQLLTTFLDPNNRIQPLTARPAGTFLGTDPYVPDTRIYYVGTGRFLGNTDLADQGPGAAAWQQSLYGVRDPIDELDAFTFTPLTSFRTGNVVVQTISQGSGGNRVLTKNPVDWKAKDGFYIDLNPLFGTPPVQDSPGERITLDVRLIHGTLIFISQIPNAGGSCIPGGDSVLYGLDFQTGGYVGNDATAGHRLGAFLVGAALIQTSQGIKVLAKTLPGQNIPVSVPIDTKFLSKRFSFRER